jgi:hypothetical protein
VEGALGPKCLAQVCRKILWTEGGGQILGPWSDSVRNSLERVLIEPKEAHAIRTESDECSVQNGQGSRQVSR